MNDEEVDSVVDLIQWASHTGKVGDGKICLYSVELIVRIRTGDRLDRVE